MHVLDKHYKSRLHVNQLNRSHHTNTWKLRQMKSVQDEVICVEIFAFSRIWEGHCSFQFMYFICISRIEISCKHFCINIRLIWLTKPIEQIFLIEVCIILTFHLFVFDIVSLQDPSSNSHRTFECSIEKN